MFANRFFADRYFAPRFWPTGAGDIVEPPVVEERQGGGGSRKRKPFKSYDQRQRERQEAIHRERFGELPKGLEDELKPAPSPYKRLSPETVKAYQNAVYAGRQDDEEAINLIMALL